MVERLRSMPVAEVYERLRQRATQAQEQLDAVAAAIPGTPDGTFTYPLPTQEQFAGMWPEILANDRLTRYWARRLGVPDASNADSPHHGLSSPTGIDGMREEAA